MIVNIAYSSPGLVICRSGWAWALRQLIRFHWVLAPNAKLRPQVVPQGPEAQEWATEVAVADGCETETAQSRRAACSP